MNKQDKVIETSQKWLENMKKNNPGMPEIKLLEELIELADNRVATPFGTIRISDMAKFYDQPQIIIELDTPDNGEEMIAMVEYDEDEKQIAVTSWRPNSLDAHNVTVTHTEELVKDRSDMLKDYKARGKTWK